MTSKSYENPIAILMVGCDITLPRDFPGCLRSLSGTSVESLDLLDAPDGGKSNDP